MVWQLASVDLCRCRQIALMFCTFSSAHFWLSHTLINIHSVVDIDWFRSSFFICLSLVLQTQLRKMLIIASPSEHSRVTRSLRVKTQSLVLMGNGLEVCRVADRSGVMKSRPNLLFISKSAGTYRCGCIQRWIIGGQIYMTSANQIKIKYYLKESKPVYALV